MSDFQRPSESFRYSFGGLKTNAAPNSLPPNKYNLAVNVRAYDDDSVRTRPGYTPILKTSFGMFTDLRAYTALFTDNLPRFLARDAIDRIVLDTGTIVGTLAGAGASPGATLIPFRPNSSPNPWMYICNGNDYQKFSSPSATNVATAQKVGIAEPQSAPEAVVSTQQVSFLDEPVLNPGYTNSGTAGAVSIGSRVTDTVQAVFPDPAGFGVSSTIQTGGGTTSGGVTSIAMTKQGNYSSAPTVTISGGGGTGATAVATHYSIVIPHQPPLNFITIAVTAPGSGYTSPPTVTLTGGGSGGVAVASIGAITTPTVEYQRFEVVIINSLPYTIQDVFPPLPIAIAIQGIYYFSGTTGRCIVVPANLFAGPGNGDTSLYSATVLASLRRGGLVNIGTETCLISSVSRGPDGTISFETTTTNNHTTAEFLTGAAGIQVLGVLLTGNSISSPDAQFQVTTGLGAVTFPVTTNPFTYTNFSFQPEDYFHFSVNIDNLANLTEMKVLIDVGDGSFTQNFYYFTVRPNDIIPAILNSLTQIAAAQVVSQRALIDEELAQESANQGGTFSSDQTVTGNGQWSEILIPLSSFTRVGNDETRSLQNVNHIQFLFNASGTINVKLNSTTITGGYQPDVGDVGAPLRYRVRPRSSLTGAVGNPSPETRYGVTPRRQQVLLSLPSAAYDPQIDTWDIFRYGGAVTSWRYVGSTLSSNAQFSDNFDDASVQAGDALDFDNFEPWPSVDVPNVGTASTVCGTVAVVSSTDMDIASYLPGTLVQLAGQNAYTLQARPTLISGNNYLLQFVENAGAGTNVPYAIQEPFIANQMLPYSWGADANGTVFACGDKFRPGTVYFAKNYAPDSVPDSYNIEVSPPTEPLLGGVIMDGLSYVASTERWWAMYPQPDNPTQRYSLVQLPVTRGVVSPWGICTDGKSIYWWAKDGIYSSSTGSLTDADLYNLFPHEGVPGHDVSYAGYIIPAPSYAQAKGFRLSYSNGYLYATYLDASLKYHQLVLDLKRMAWSIDAYNVQVSNVYHVEQQSASGPLATATLNPVTILSGESAQGSGTGALYQQSDLHNDDMASISVYLSTFEFDGGDLRAPKQWGDLFVDCVPASAVTINLASESAIFAGPYTVSANSSRQRVPVDLGAELVTDFAGLYTKWTDDFTSQLIASRIYAWQPSFDVQPARAAGWRTFGGTFGKSGYFHVYEMILAYVSTAPVTLTITAYDGQSPAAIVLPSTGGAYQKTTFRVGANKGMLFKFQMGSSAPFQVFEDDCEISIGEWGRSGAYSVERAFGGIAQQTGAV